MISLQWTWPIRSPFTVHRRRSLPPPTGIQRIVGHKSHWGPKKKRKEKKNHIADFTWVTDGCDVTCGLAGRHRSHRAFVACEALYITEPEETQSSWEVKQTLHFTSDLERYEIRNVLYALSVQISHTLTCSGPTEYRCHLYWHWWGCCRVCRQTGWWLPPCARTGELEIPPPSPTAMDVSKPRHILETTYRGQNSCMWFIAISLKKKNLLINRSSGIERIKCY